ncbi:MAG TPA: hypothetical protein PKA12_05490 [Saprospiraceae bacterium]|nr:hypothetical protein [Saprospiraceae bacterium]
MNPYNIDDLPKNLTAWLYARLLQPILYIEGGWEYWFQIDFPAWMDVVDKTQYDFRREVILPGVRLDWLINSNSIGQIPVAVEIKAQTHKYKNDVFEKDVMEDIEKLKGLKGKYEKMMIAAVIDEKMKKRLIELGFTFIATDRDHFTEVLVYKIK